MPNAPAEASCSLIAGDNLDSHTDWLILGSTTGHPSRLRHFPKQQHSLWARDFSTAEPKFLTAMLFPSFAFFCVVFAIYWRLPRLRLRNGWLVVASCVFYGTWNPWLISLILFTAAVDYVMALRLMTTESPAMRRARFFRAVTSVRVLIGLRG